LVLGSIPPDEKGACFGGPVAGFGTFGPSSSSFTGFNLGAVQGKGEKSRVVRGNKGSHGLSRLS